MLEDNDRFVSADVYITPPDQGELTDEDSGPEDEDGPIDNLSGAQLRSEAEVIIQQYDDVIRFGEEDPDTESVQSSTEDVTPNDRFVCILAFFVSFRNLNTTLSFCHEDCLHK